MKHIDDELAGVCNSRLQKSTAINGCHFRLLPLHWGRNTYQKREVGKKWCYARYRFTDGVASSKFMRSGFESGDWEWEG